MGLRRATARGPPALLRPGSASSRIRMDVELNEVFRAWQQSVLTRTGAMLAKWNGISSACRFASAFQGRARRKSIRTEKARKWPAESLRSRSDRSP